MNFQFIELLYAAKKDDGPSFGAAHLLFAAFTLNVINQPAVHFLVIRMIKVDIRLYIKGLLNLLIKLIL